MLSWKITILDSRGGSVNPVVKGQGGQTADQWSRHVAASLWAHHVGKYREKSRCQLE